MADRYGIFRQEDPVKATDIVKEFDATDTSSQQVQRNNGGIGQWLKQTWNSLYPSTSGIQTDEDRERVARQRAKVGNWTRLLGALGNAYAVGQGAYSATIPADTSEKTIGDWKAALKEQKMKQATLEEQRRQFDQTMQYNRQKMAEDRAARLAEKKEALEYRKQNDEANRLLRETIANNANATRIQTTEMNNRQSGINAVTRANASGQGGSKGKYEFNGTDYKNQKAYEAAITAWAKANGIATTGRKGKARDFRSVHADVMNKLNQK